MKKLTEYQEKQKRLFEEVLLDPDFYYEFSLLRRDAISPLRTSEGEASLDGRLIRLMEKSSVQIECFFMLKKARDKGGDFDFSLIRKVPREKYYAKRDAEIYRLWLQDRLRPKQIAQKLYKNPSNDEVLNVAKILSRQRAKDPNPKRDYGPPFKSVFRRRSK